MTTCRTLAEVIAAGREAGLAAPALSQAQADHVAAILAPHADLLASVRAAQQLPRPGGTPDAARGFAATDAGREVRPGHQQDAA